MCILDLSKVLSQVFHYDYIKNKYDYRSKLLITDTDSLMYEIKTEEVHEDFNSYKLVIGKMKNELEALRLKNLLN